VKMTASAREFWKVVKAHTADTTIVEAEQRLQAMLDRREADIVNVSMVKHALRNLGKAPGAEVPVGQPSEPLDASGYPEVGR